MRCTSRWAKFAYATGVWDPPRVTADLQPSESDRKHVARLVIKDDQHCFSHERWLEDVMRDVASTKGFSAGPRFHLKVERFENSDHYTWDIGNARTFANVTTTDGDATDDDRREFALLLFGAAARVAPTDFAVCKRYVWVENDEISELPKVSLVSGLSQKLENLAPLRGPIMSLRTDRRGGVDFERHIHSSTFGPTAHPGFVHFVVGTGPGSVPLKGDVVVSNRWDTGLQAEPSAKTMPGYALKVLQCVAAAGPTKALNLQATLRHTDASDPTGKPTVQAALVTTLGGSQNLDAVLPELRRCVVDVVPAPRLQAFFEGKELALCEKQREDAVKPAVFIENAPAATGMAPPVAPPVAAAVVTNGATAVADKP
jgi:hypothetical protein